MKITAFFTNAGVPAPGLSPTVRIRDLEDDSLVITDAAMSESGDGHYKYEFESYDATKDYAVRCDGTGTLPNTDRYKYAGNENYFDDIQEAVWSTPLSAYSGMGQSGEVQQCLLYGNEVVINSINGQSGTEFPTGTGRYPSNNLTDALIISNNRKINKLKLQTDLTVAASHDISNMSVETIGIMGTEVTFQAGCSADNTAFRNLDLTGTITAGDEMLVEDCQILDLANFSGIMNNVSLGQNIILSLANWALIIRGTAGGTAYSRPKIDIGNSNLNISEWTGNLKLRSKTADNISSINCNSADIQLGASLATGTIQLLGIGVVENDTPSGCSVDVSAFISRESISESVWDEPLVDHTNDQTTGHALLQQSYSGEVYIDTVSGSPGIVYPAGIRQHPVNSLSDALTVSSLYNLSTIHVIGALTVSAGEDLSGLTFHSDRSLGNSVTLVSYTTDYTYFNDLTVSGDLTGSTRLTYCVLGSLTGLEGGIKNSLITDDIEFVKNGNNYMTDCDRFISAENTYVNINIADSEFNMIRGRGNYNITGKTSTGITTLDLNGSIRVDSTCVSGTIVVAGLTRVIDQSGPNCLVLDASLTNSTIADAVWSETVSGHTAEASFSGMLQRTVGLLHENINIDNPVYDGDTNLTSARVRLYSNPASVGTANDVIGTYEVTAPGDGAGKFTVWKQVKV